MKKIKMRINNTSNRGRFYHYEINGIKKKIFIAGHSFVEIPEVSNVYQMNFNAHEEALMHVEDRFGYDFGFNSGVLSQGTSSDKFIFVLTLTAGTEITIMHDSGYTHNYTVNWGDGGTSSVASWSSTSRIHTYAGAGSYTVSIDGICESFTTALILPEASPVPYPISSYITRIVSWGKAGGFKFLLLGLSINLTSLPNESGKLTSLTNLFGTFAFTSISSIPSGVFAGNTVASALTYTFAYCSLLTSVPDNLFDSNIGVLGAQGVFSDCAALTHVPNTLFKNNTEVSSFESLFANCSSLTGVSSSLFSTNTKTNSFRQAFANCTSLTSVPGGLFNNNTAVTTFSNVFYNNASLESIPSGLFDNNTLVSNVEGAFFLCKKLSTIPAGLFDNNVMVSSFRETFRSCSGLTAIPSGLFDNTVSAINFESAFKGCVSLSGNAPTLWVSYSGASGSGCFNQDKSLTNYDDIPAAWK